MQRQVHSIFEEVYSSSVAWLFDLRRNSIKPLHRIEVREGEMVVTFDLPGVEKEDISLSATEDELSIEAKMKRPIWLMVGGSFQKRVQFERYAKKINLPVKVDPDQAKAKVRNGLLTTRFSLAHEGTIVKVE